MWEDIATEKFQLVPNAVRARERVTSLAEGMGSSIFDTELE